MQGSFFLPYCLEGHKAERLVPDQKGDICVLSQVVSMTSYICPKKEIDLMKFSVELVICFSLLEQICQTVFWILTMFLSIFFKQFWFIDIYHSCIMLPRFGRKEVSPSGCCIPKLLP